MNLQEQISRIKSMMGLIVEEDDLSLSDLEKRDQEMRMDDEKTMDMDIDLDNQKHLKRILGDNPEKFIQNINSFEDLKSVWLITQHADNDVEFQKMILNSLQKNIRTLIEKFPSEEMVIKQGIAMLTDRIMVNSTVTNFSDISDGIQKYGSQGGTHNGIWVPRRIKMGGKTYFFNTPEELLNNTNFLFKINRLRNEMGLQPLEDYVRHMQKYNQ